MSWTLNEGFCLNIWYLTFIFLDVCIYGYKFLFKYGFSRIPQVLICHVFIII